MAAAATACWSAPTRAHPPKIVMPPPEERARLWREDLDFLVRTLSDRHVAPFRRVSESDFRGDVEDLETRIPDLRDEDVVIEMARLAAMLGDGHTGFLLHGPRLGLRPGPLWLMAFADGIYVKGIVGDVGVDILNHRLVRIGGVPTSEALRRLAPYIMRDNDIALLAIGPAYMNLPGVLNAAGLTDQIDSANYTLADSNGAEIEVQLDALRADQPVVFHVRYGPGVSGAPLAERLRTKNYAFERIGDGALLQYNTCTDDPAEDFVSFCERVFAEIDRSPPRVLVIDLRANVGGDSDVTRALYRQLTRRPDLASKGRLRVLIGRTTFSSGMWAAVDLARDFGAVLYGEPTGGKPNAPGEQLRFSLPHSTLDCAYATRTWRAGGDEYPGEALYPVVPVMETAAEHFNGLDPVLAEALRRRNPRVAVPAKD